MPTASKASAPRAAATPKPEVTAYNTEEVIFATRYKQGGRTVYALDLSPNQLANLVKRPDPNQPTPGNRAIRPAHAQGFAKYVREHQNWVVPGMILRAPNIFSFEPLNEVEGAQFGLLSFPKRSSSDIHILDGQHRTLGFHLALEGIAQDLDKARSALASARRVDPDGAAVVEAKKRIKELETQRTRLDQERVSLQIFVEEDMAAYKQMFFDIADNALGITASVKARFDARKVVNRALPEVLEHPLLKNRVDLEADRVGRGSPYLLGAKHVAEIVRSLQVGLDGRVSRRQDAEWSEVDIANKAKAFFDMLVETFPPLQAVMLGQILPDDLRKTSLLGSVLMLRSLAGVHFELRTNHAFDTDAIAAYFSQLAPHMVGPVYEGSIWLSHAPDGTFTEGAFGPSGRRQDLKALTMALTDWAVDKEKFVTAPPAPRPKPEPTEEDHPEYGAGYTAVGADIPKKKK